jgi:hypothetical protein
MKRAGEEIPAPGSGRGRAKFASNERLQTMETLLSDFWDRILGVSLVSSFVSDKSTLDSWEHYVGGRENLIQRVRDNYGVDIAPVYEMLLPDVLIYISERASNTR